uniref:BTB domain-containing protein n=1 Tax=Fagus sylvatica TaxID=28930 RepID=A0A2N9IC50_FAGSY
MEPQYPKPRSYGPQIKMTIPPSHSQSQSQHSDNDRSSVELRALDCNLTSLCDHIQMEGFNSGSFSDIVVHAMSSTYHLHRLILSRSSYFRFDRNLSNSGWPYLDWEMESFLSFLELLYSVTIIGIGEDKVCWQPSQSHTVQSIWKAKVTPRVAFFTWTAALGRILMADNLRRRRVMLVSWCYMCKADGESVDHLLLHCVYAKELWDVVFAMFGVFWVMPGRVRELFACWQGKMGKHPKNMLHGPWKEANAPIVTLHVDDKNVNSEAITMALAYLYGHHPKLTDNNAFRVLAAASFLDLQDLCAICTDFIISELWMSNFLAYQVFAESQDYGIHGERVRNACWGYLCQSGAMELKEVLPKLSSQTLHALLTSDELWVPSEEKRFELALCTFLAKVALCKAEHSEQGSCSSETGTESHSDSPQAKGKNLVDSCTNKRLECELGRVSLKDDIEGHNAAHNLLVELADCVVDCQTGASNSSQQVQEAAYSQLNMEPRYPCNMDGPSSLSPSLADIDGSRASCSYIEMSTGVRASGLGATGMAMEGPSEEGSCYHLNNNNWLSQGPIKALLFNELFLQPFGFSHGGTTQAYYMQEHDQNTALGNMGNVYVAESGQGEGNGLFRPVRVHVRGPIDGLAGIGRGTTFVPAAAWPPTRFVFSRVPFGMGNRNCQQSLANDDSEARADHSGDLSGDGLTALVGLSQGGSNVSNVHEEQRERGYEMDLQSRMSGTSVAGPSTSSVPMQMLESPEHAVGIEWENADSSSISLDMKTPLSHFPPFRFGHCDLVDTLTVCWSTVDGLAPEPYETQQSRALLFLLGCCSMILLALMSPSQVSQIGEIILCTWVQFEDVHRLSDGQVKHSPEVFYAGSLWKVSVQAFNDEDPQGRRTLGLFLHRRKAEITDSHRKVHMYVDSREKVTARYQLICPSKREVMVFGSFKQTGTLLPKAPKGWGWRTALLFDELADLLQSGTLRVAAVVQLV